MTCSACQRANLPGGVRCIYCGTPFPPPPEFDLVIPGAPADEATAAPAAPPPPGRGATGLLVGGLVLAFKWKSLVTLLSLGKLLPTLASMAVFAWAQAQLMGWPLAVGFAVCILIHELGHVYVNRRHGFPATAPMFIPFAGAVIFLKRFPNNPTFQAESGAGGPVAGTLAALVCLRMGEATGERFWYTLALIGFAMNLFNLLPFPPLDGSHIAAVFSPRTWNVVLAVLLLWVLKVPWPVLWLLLVAGFVFRMGRTEHGRHNLATPLDRVRMAAVYLALCLVLGWGIDTSLTRGDLRPGDVQATRGAQAPAAQVEAPAPAREARPRADASSPAGEEKKGSSRIAGIVMGTLAGGLLLLALAGWPVTAALLAGASGERFGLRGLALVAWMNGALFAALGAGMLAGLPGSDLMMLAWAWLAALAGGGVFALWQRVQGSPHGNRVPRAWLTWRCLGWSAMGALIVAYAAENLWVAAAVALGAVVFYARRPWLLLSRIARTWVQLGRLERAVALRERALALGPEPEVAVDLLHGIALAQLDLGRGEAALAALDRAAAYGNQVAPGPVAALLMGAARAAALILVGRYDEALAQCEQLLRAPEGDPVGPARVIVVHELLSELALARGWNDEAAAQARCVLARVSKHAAGLLRSLAADAHRLRAAAEVAEGRLVEARADCERALAWSREPAVEGAVTVVRAQADFAAGNAEAAEQAASDALRRLPGSLAAAYWRARALAALGRVEEAGAVMGDLAARYPRDHWGRQAQGFLSQPAAATAP